MAGRRVTELALVAVAVGVVVAAVLFVAGIGRTRVELEYQFVASCFIGGCVAMGIVLAGMAISRMTP